MADIAVLGHGVVGSGVLEVLLTHRESITRRAKEEIRVKHILDLRDFPQLPTPGCSPRILTKFCKTRM